MKDYRINRQRLTQREKDANGFQWYKDQCNLLDNHSFSSDHFLGLNGTTEYKRKKVNYDLFNNILNMADLQYVCKPFGEEAGDLPANFTNRDIVSGKIKVLLGMEMKMPFSWRVIAVNEEATTRKEQQQASMLRDFVNAQIMQPIKEAIEMEIAEQNKGKALNEEEKMQIQQRIAEETKARTPDEIRRYMAREHQDPAEILAHQLLEYLTKKERVADKFNKGFKHSCLSGEEFYWVGILNGEPCMKVVNTLFFDYDKSPDLDYIEDGEWAVHEYRMTPTEVISNFGSELKEDQIDKIYQYHNASPEHIHNSDFSFNLDERDAAYTVRVLHSTWKSLKKIGFLTFDAGDGGEPQMSVVDENYKLNKALGDIAIEWEWIPETHETYKILDDIYVYTRPIPGQYKDMDNLWNCKLPYYGAATDNLNSPTTSPMDRMKMYQYYYDIILYRTELLMASDKGKILAANINAIPKSAGLDISKFMYFMEANKIAWFNPQEEGNRGQGGDITNMVKEIDMSLISDIKKYIDLAEYIEMKCGNAIGVTKAMEAQIGPNEAVTNTQQNLVQASHIIQPHFELHNNVKGNVLTALLEAAKVAYSGGKQRKLSYILDDMSYAMLTVDQDLLENSVYGLFVSNSSKAADAKRAVEGLAQAALQNQQADLGDIIKIIRSDSVTEAEEMLAAAKQRASEEAQAIEQQKIQAAERARQSAVAEREAEREHEKEMVVLKEEERRKTEIQKQAMFSLGFDPEKDVDNDGTPDVLEVAKFGVDADVKRRKQDLDEQKFEQQKKIDAEKIKLENKKLAQQKNKGTSK